MYRVKAQKSRLKPQANENTKKGKQLQKKATNEFEHGVELKFQAVLNIAYVHVCMCLLALKTHTNC